MRDKLIMTGRTKKGNVKIKGFRKSFPVHRQVVKGKIEELIWMPTFFGQGYFIKVPKSKKK